MLRAFRRAELQVSMCIRWGSSNCMVRACFLVYFPIFFPRGREANWALWLATRLVFPRGALTIAIIVTITFTPLLLLLPLLLILLLLPLWLWLSSTLISCAWIACHSQSPPSSMLASWSWRRPLECSSLASTMKRAGPNEACRADFRAQGARS